MELSDDLDVSGGVRLTPAITGRLSKYVPRFQEPPCTAAGGQGTTGRDTTVALHPESNWLVGNGS